MKQGGTKLRKFWLQIITNLTTKGPLTRLWGYTQHLPCYKYLLNTSGKVSWTQQILKFLSNWRLRKEIQIRLKILHTHFSKIEAKTKNSLIKRSQENWYNEIYLTTLNIERVSIQLIQWRFLYILHKNKQKIQFEIPRVGGWDEFELEDISEIEESESSSEFSSC